MVSLRPSAGLIHTTTYYTETDATDTTPGGVEGYVEFFNLLNRANIGNTFEGSVLSSITTGANTPPRRPQNVKDLQPLGLLGSSFGAGTTIGVPFQAQFGFRVSF